MTHGLITELTSRECQRYLVEGGDIALLPVGSVEALGPHLPVGGRCFVVEAFARLMAEQVGGLRMPTVAFSTAPHTFDQPGSLALPEATVDEYVRAAMDDLLAAGFRRILVVTFLGYLSYYIPQEFYEDHQVAAAGMDMGDVLHHYGRAKGVGEDSVIVGALVVLGKQSLADRVMAENKRLLDGGQAGTALPEVLRALSQAGAVGYTHPPGSYPLPPNPDLSAEAGAQVLRDAAGGLAPAVGSLREYNEFLAKRRRSRGLMWRGWRWNE